MDLALAEKVIPQRVDLLDRQGFIDQLQGIVDILAKNKKNMSSKLKFQ